MVTSVPHLAEQTGLTISQVRTALKHLYSSGDVAEITQKLADGKKANYTILKVENYVLYQGDDRPLADQSQTDDRPIADRSQQTRIKELRIKELEDNSPPTPSLSGGKKGKKKPAFNPEQTIRDYTTNPELANALMAFVELRKQMKKPLTEYGLNRNLSTLNGLAADDWTKVQIVNQSVEHAWQGFYQLKNDTTYRMPGNGGSGLAF